MGAREDWIAEITDCESTIAEKQAKIEKLKRFIEVLDNPDFAEVADALQAKETEAARKAQQAAQAAQAAAARLPVPVPTNQKAGAGGAETGNARGYRASEIDTAVMAACRIGVLNVLTAAGETQLSITETIENFISNMGPRWGSGAGKDAIRKVVDTLLETGEIEKGSR